MSKSLMFPFSEARETFDFCPAVWDAVFVCRVIFVNSRIFFNYHVERLLNISYLLFRFCTRF